MAKNKAYRQNTVVVFEYDNEGHIIARGGQTTEYTQADYFNRCNSTSTHYDAYGGSVASQPFFPQSMFG